MIGCDNQDVSLVKSTEIPIKSNPFQVIHSVCVIPDFICKGNQGLTLKLADLTCELGLTKHKCTPSLFYHVVKAIQKYI